MRLVQTTPTATVNAYSYKYVMKKITLTAALIFVPSIASAQALLPLATFVRSVNSIVGTLIPLLMAIALVVFFWGLIKYISNSGKGYQEGKNIMIAGLASLFVMVSVWGIVNLAQSALGVNANPTVTIPAVPGVGGGSPYGSGGYVAPGPTGAMPAGYDSYGRPGM